MPVPSLSCVEQELQAEVAARDRQVPYGRPSAASVSGTGRIPQRPAAASRTTRSGAGPNPFWWNV